MRFSRWLLQVSHCFGLLACAKTSPMMFVCLFHAQGFVNRMNQPTPSNPSPPQQPQVVVTARLLYYHYITVLLYHCDIVLQYHCEYLQNTVSFYKLYY